MFLITDMEKDLKLENVVAFSGEREGCGGDEVKNSTK